MKLGLQSHNDVATGVQGETDISFEANGVAFYAQISGLAKDKISYPIRELSTNAWDASRGDFEVHLPTQINPVFRVRDRGPGISPENMEKVFAKLYASTKRNTNTEVGGWGLGSKSPYAYLITDEGAGSYNVTSYYGGMMRTYVLSLSNDGKPKMRLLIEAASDEHSGLEVSFAVRREDIWAFQTKANRILWSFNPRPKISPEPGWDEPVVEASGEGWTLFKRDSVPFSRPQVRMGCVMYPFDLSQIKTQGFVRDNDCLLFEAPIGSLKVTLSREELAYDSNTKQTLSELVERYEANFKKQVQDLVDETNTYFAACRAFQIHTEPLGHDRQSKLRDHIKWNGMYLRDTIDGKDDAYRFTPFKTDVLGEGWGAFDKFEHGQFKPSAHADSIVVMEHSPSYSLARMRLANLTGKKVLWVRTKRLFREAVLKILGNPEVIDLDAFKVAPGERRPKGMRKRRTLKFTHEGEEAFLYQSTQDVDLTQGGYFVRETWGGRSSKDRYNIREGGAVITQSDLRKTLEFCVEHGLFDAEATILIRKDDEVLGDNWEWLGSDIIDSIRALVDVSEFSGLNKKGRSSLDDGLIFMAKARRVKKPAAIEDLCRDVRSMLADLAEYSQRQESVTDKAFEVLNKLKEHVSIPDTQDPIAPLNERWNALSDQYPLLDVIMSNHGWQQDIVRDRLKHYFKLEMLAAQSASSTPPQEGDEDEEDMAQAA